MDGPDISDEMRRMTVQLKSKSPDVKRNMLQKLKAVVNPEMSDLQPPEVQEDTRGRPTTKSQQQRKGKVDPEPQVNFSRPKKSNKGKGRAQAQPDEPIDPDFPLLVHRRYAYCLQLYKTYIPSVYRPYVEHIEDVLGDGNCGYRAVAVGLGGNENEWRSIRRALLNEVGEHLDGWKEIIDGFERGALSRTFDSINWFGLEEAQAQHWMDMPYTRFLIAQRFGVIVQVLANNGSQSLLPMFDGPDMTANRHTITLCNADNRHWFYLRLSENAPIPIPNTLWNRNRWPAASLWQTLYEQRLAHGRHLEEISRPEQPQFYNLM